MGVIRGTHTSPGVYTKYTEISRNGDKIASGKLSSQSGSGGGVGKFPQDRYWVFGDVFPIVFS